MNENDNDIYRAPASDLQPDEKVPESFASGAFCAGKLRLLGWLSLFYLVVSLADIVASIVSDIRVGEQSIEELSRGLEILNAAVYTYLLVMLRGLLHSRFGFHRVDGLINVIIGLVIVMTLLSPFMSQGEEIDPVTMAYFALLIPCGISLALFGKRLLLIEERYSYLKMFAWSNIVMGVGMATVVLILLALPAGIISDFAMMMLFFTAAKELRGAEARG